MCVALSCNSLAQVINLEETNVSMDMLRKEILILGMTDHPNVVPYYVSFVNSAEMRLWIVMEYMDCGR